MTAVPFVHIAPAIEAIETITLWGAKAYTLGSEIFTVSAILWVLNFMGNMTQKTFEFGYAFGKFYRRYLHSHLKGFALGVIALVILMGQLTFEGAQVVYNNRREILENVNTFRTRVGSYFVYAWLILTLCRLWECPLNRHRDSIRCILLKSSGNQPNENSDTAEFHYAGLHNWILLGRTCCQVGAYVWVQKL